MFLTSKYLVHLGEGPYGNLDHRIELRNNSIEGRGLFAKYFIPQGTIVWMNRHDGPMNKNYMIFRFDQLEELNQDYQNCITKYGSQLTDNTIQGPLTESDAMMDYSNFFNHSCSPNVWPININQWEARFDINPGDELTIDYVTFDCNEFSGFQNCRCSSLECRGEIKKNDYLNADIQKKYKGHFVEFIQKRISSD
jgi:SET domain-containing protein